MGEPMKRMQRPDIEWDLRLEIPKKWRTAPLLTANVLKAWESEDGHPLVLASGELMDGTALVTLMYSGGAMVARSSPHGFETSQQGRKPLKHLRPVIDEVWRMVMETLHLILREVREAWDAQDESIQEELRQRALRVVTGTCQAVAYQYAESGGFDDAQYVLNLLRLETVVARAFGFGATRAEVARAVADAKDVCVDDAELAFLDAMIEDVINLPKEVEDAAPPA